MASAILHFFAALAQPCGIWVQANADVLLKLDTNIDALKEATRELEARKKDIKQRIFEAKLKDELNLVKNWIEKVKKEIVSADGWADFERTRWRSTGEGKKRNAALL